MAKYGISHGGLLMRSINTVTFGCDPEFIVVSNRKTGKLVNAGKLGLGYNTAIGADGCLFEIRPGYSNNILEVMHGILFSLRETYIRLPAIRRKVWLSGHYPTQRGAAIGGHVHIRNLSEQNIDAITQILKSILIDIVSNTIDDLPQRVLRRRAGYGDAFDTRHPALGAVEFRAPGSFLISPKVTFLNLILTKASVMLLKSCPTLHDSVYEMEPAILFEQLLNLLRNMRKPPDDIKFGLPIIESFVNDNWKIDWKKDFKKAWGISDDIIGDTHEIM
jgi:hypothetical protein